VIIPYDRAPSLLTHIGPKGYTWYNDAPDQ
jgi:hypothetical protein